MPTGQAYLHSFGRVRRILDVRENGESVKAAGGVLCFVQARDSGGRAAYVETHPYPCRHEKVHAQNVKFVYKLVTGA